MADVLIIASDEDLDVAAALERALESIGLSAATSVDPRGGDGACRLFVMSDLTIQNAAFIEAAAEAGRTRKAAIARFTYRPLPLSLHAAPTFGLIGWDGDPHAPEIEGLLSAVERIALAGRTRTRSGQPESNPLAEETAAWKAIQNGDDPEAFRAFLARYGPDSPFAELAQLRLDQLEIVEPPAPPSQPRWTGWSVRAPGPGAVRPPEPPPPFPKPPPPPAFPRAPAADLFSPPTRPPAPPPPPPRPAPPPPPPPPRPAPSYARAPDPRAFEPPVDDIDDYYDLPPPPRASRGRAPPPEPRGQGGRAGLWLAVGVIALLAGGGFVLFGGDGGETGQSSAAPDAEETAEFRYQTPSGDESAPADEFAERSSEATSLEEAAIAPLTDEPPPARAAPARVRPPPPSAATGGAVVARPPESRQAARPSPPAPSRASPPPPARAAAPAESRYTAAELEALAMMRAPPAPAPALSPPPPPPPPPVREPQGPEPTVVASVRPPPPPPPAAAAPAEGVVRWAASPSARQLQEAYPTRAADAGESGVVVLRCLIGSDLRPQCAVVSETPPRRGFGAAALSVARNFRAQPTLSNGAPAAGANASISIRFQTQ